jgi:transcriptional regulator with XRE-family HTH domain
VTSKEELGRNARAARLAAGLTLEAVAARAGVSVRSVTRVERAEHVPRPATIAAIAAVLGTTPEALGVEDENGAAA